MRLLLVLQLALLVLAAHHDAGRHVGDPDRGVGGVDALAARAAAAEDVDAQVVLVDRHVDLLGLGQHQHAGRAGVHAALRLGDRHPLDAVHAALELQQRVRRLARLRGALGLHRDGHGLVAAEVGLGGVEHLDRTSRAASAYRVYMRSRSPANSADSSPPSPDFTSRIASLSSVGSRGTSRRRSRSSASPRCFAKGVGLVGERRVLGGQLAGRLEVARRSCCHSRQVADDRAQLGVALVEPLGQPRVGVGLGRGQPALELGVLGEQALDGLEHRHSSVPVVVTKTRRRPRTGCVGRRRERATGREPTPGQLRGLLVGGLLLGVAGLEPGDAAAGVEDLLLAGVERVALRAHVGVDDAATSRCCGW